MTTKIILPEVKAFRLRHFEPIFRSDISIQLPPGPSVILGGNALGKTTIVQAVVYGLTGGASESTENEKIHRWNQTYFQERLNASSEVAPVVEIDFDLGSERFTVERGISSSTALRFRHIGKKDSWIDDPQEAKVAYEEALRNHGGYVSGEDFRFVVHRLIYLSEARRLLAWDTDAQLRIFMLLNQDVTREDDFRHRREELRRLDSERRHTHVALNKVIGQISVNEERKNPKLKNQDEPVRGPSKERLIRAIEGLQGVIDSRYAADRKRAAARENLSKISAEIEIIREGIEQTEASLFDVEVSKYEHERSLPLDKLTESGICPACGTLQKHLQDMAQKHRRHHQCVICGSQKPHRANEDVETLRSRLSEKLRAQRQIESELLAHEELSKALSREESSFQAVINEARRESPVRTLLERNVSEFSSVDLPKVRRRLEREEADYLRQIQGKQKGLERDFQEYRQAVEDRVIVLRTLYARYATAFLGIPCELIEQDVSDLFQFKRFIPVFDGKERPTPSSCSEAQRFFLDIAFRLALIDYASTVDAGRASFICETPENALDMTYVDNVVEMFARFSESNHRLLLTANIQRDSFAARLLRKYKDRDKRVVNLLEIGRLSEVQKKGLPALKRVVAEILGR